MNKILMSMLAIILAFDAHAETELQRLHKVEESVASLKMQHRFSPKLQEKAAGFQWVLVDGIFGDALSEGSSDFQNVLEKEVGASNIEVIRPSSLDSIQENAEFLDGYFSLLSRKGPPLMIVAHSRGALSTLLALAANPELVESGRIAGAVYIQGAFAGSPLAEYVDSKVHGLCNLFAIKSLNATCEVYEAFAPSIETLKPEIVRKELGLEFSKLSSQQLGNLSSKSFFVKSKVSPGHASTP
ncbi:MAG: hypothetical protein ABIO95_02020, partial [Bdellovibrionota bacterium]